jgi:tryptophan 2,3-dioxygenase
MQSQDLAEVLAMLGLKQVAMLVLKGEIEEEFRALDAKLAALLGNPSLAQEEDLLTAAERRDHTRSFLEGDIVSSKHDQAIGRRAGCCGCRRASS